MFKIVILKYLKNILHLTSLFGSHDSYNSKILNRVKKEIFIYIK